MISKSKFNEISNYDKIKNFKKIKNLDENIISEIVKYYICFFLEKDSYVLFSKLNLFLLKSDWLASIVSKINDYILIPWPEIRSEYLMGKNEIFMQLFNSKNLDYISWIESLIVNSFDYSDKDGTLISKNFSDDSFVFNLIDKMNENIKVILIERDDIYFTNNNSYGMENRTDWENWNKLSLDSDIDLIGPLNLEENYNKIDIVFKAIGI